MTVAKKAVPQALQDSLSTDCLKPEDLIGDSGSHEELIKPSVAKTLEAEMADNLGHGKNGAWKLVQ